MCDEAKAVADILTFKEIATPAVGNGPDSAGFDSTLGLVFGSNAATRSLSIFKPLNGKHETADTVILERAARTMTVDGKLHRVYLPAKYGPVPEAKAGGKKGHACAPGELPCAGIGKAGHRRRVGLLSARGRPAHCRSHPKKEVAV